MRKILVVQMLRLGDVIMSLPTLRQLRLEYPDAQISLLINDGIGPIDPFLSDVDCLIKFPRTQIQSKLLDRQSSLFSALDSVERFCQKNLTDRYDLVLNLTQNHLSALLLQNLKAEKFIGLKSNEFLEFKIKGDAFGQMNKSQEGFGPENIHYQDYYGRSLGFKAILPSQLSFNLSPNKTKLKYLNQVRKPYICLQSKTSDLKKDLDQKFFENYLATFKSLSSDYDFILLGAPNEKKELLEAQGRLATRGINVFVAICSLEEAYHILKSSELLITLDTSIKHLAALAGTRTLEICMGSSDPSKTGVYLENSIVVTPSLNCWPCRHSESCTQATPFLCRSNLDPTFLASLSFSMLKAPDQIPSLAEEFNAEMNIFKVKIHPQTGYHLELVNAPLYSRILTLMAKWMSYKKLVSSDFRSDKAGTYSIEFHRVLKTFIGKIEDESQMRAINEALTHLHCLVAESKAIESSCSSSVASQKTFIQKVKAYEQLISKSRMFFTSRDEIFELSEVTVPNIYHLRALQEIERSYAAKIDISMKILRNLQSTSRGRLYEI